MKSCYIYARSASNEQGANRKSVAYQTRLCKEYAAKKGYEVVKTFEDIGISGNSSERSGLKKLMSEISFNPNSVVLVEDITRISRSYNDFNSFYIFIKKNNCSLEYLFGVVDDHSANLFWNAFTQFEREIRSQRIKAGLAVRTKKERSQNL